MALMRWRKLRFWTGMAVLSLVVLLAAWLMTGDLSVLKPQVERWVSERMGRDFAIAGRFDLDLGPRSTLIAEDVVLSDADWADAAPMLAVGRLEVRVRTGSLLRGPLVIERLELSDTELHLTERSDGPPNWVFDDAADTREPAPRRGLPVLLKEAGFRSIRIHYAAPYREAPVELTIDALRQSLGDDGFVTLATIGSLGGRRLTAEARLGTWDALLDGENIEYDVDVEIDTLNVVSRGRIDDLLEPVSPEIEFAARGPDVNDLTRILGLGDKGSGTIDLEGAVGAGGDMLELHLDGNLGQTRVAASARFPDLLRFDSIDADIEIEGPDFARIAALTGMAGIERIRRTGKLSETPFRLAVDLERRDRLLTLRRAELDFAGAEVRVSAALPEFPALDDGRVEIDARGPDLAALRALTALPPGVGGEFTVDAVLEADAAGAERYVLEAITTLGHLKAAGEILGGETYAGTTARYEFELVDAAAAADAFSLTAVSPPAIPLTGAGGIVYDRAGIQLDTPLTLTLGDMSARIGGLIVPGDKLAGSRLTVAAEAQSAASAAELVTAATGIPALPVTTTAKIDLGADGVAVSDVAGELGSARFSGEARLPSARGPSLRFTLEGPALEELIAGHPGLAFKPGPFELSASIERTDSALVVDDAVLSRPNGRASITFEAALPWERRSFSFDFTADGGDVRALLGRLGDFEPLPAAFSVKARGERSGNLLTVDRFDAKIGDATASASGLLNLRDKASDTDFVLKLDAPDMAAVGRLGDRAFSSQPLALAAEVESRGNSIEAKTFSLRLGDSTVDALLRYEAGPIPNLDVTLVADTVTFEPLLQRVDDDRPPRAERGDGRMIPDVSLPFDLLDGRKGSLRARIGRLERGSIRLRNVDVDAVLEGGVLEVRDLSFRAPSGFLRSTAVASRIGETGRVDVELIADDLTLVLGESDADLTRTGDANLRLTASGDDLRTLLGTLDGAALFDFRGGRVSKNRFLRALYGDLLNEIVVTVNPFARADPVTPIECIVVPLDIGDGRISDELASFIATDKIKLTIRADVDLGSEALDIGVRSRPKKRLSISAAELLNPYIKVVGTLAKPTLAVDEQGALIAGGAAVMTGGLSILAQAAWDRLNRAENPCEAARSEAEKALAGRLSQLEPLPVKTDGLSDP